MQQEMNKNITPLVDKDLSSSVVSESSCLALVKAPDAANKLLLLILVDYIKNRGTNRPTIGDTFVQIVHTWREFMWADRGNGHLFYWSILCP